MDHSSRHTRCRGATSDLGATSNLTYWGGGGAGMRRSGAVGRSPKAIAKRYASTRARTSIIGVYQPPFIAGAIRYQKNKMKPTPIIWFHHNRRARGSRHARPSRLTRWMRRVPSCALAKADCGVARYSGHRSPIGLCQNCVCAASAFRRRTQQVAFLPFQVHMNLGRPAHGVAIGSVSTFLVMDGLGVFW